jgi:hypothetical protein
LVEYRPSELDQVQLVATVLSSFQSEFDYLARDHQHLLRRTSERAFVHLQRLIVVDKLVRDAWDGAFRAGELECEQLGATHLLAHGIWAFKVSATGERTDLVYNEPLDITQDVRTADGLVLTEWKRITRQGEATRVALAAVEQAKRYAHGALGGVELANTRFIVLVSETALAAQQDVQDREISYRFINIAVSPRTPSQG